MDQLIHVLIMMIVFAVLAFAMKWTCDQFFSGFKPAYWVCGVILLIIILYFVSSQMVGAGAWWPVHKSNLPGPPYGVVK